MISTVNFKVIHESGKEGTRYEPYPYDEFHIKFKPELQQPDIVLHEGISQWIKIGEIVVPEEHPHKLFTHLLGFTTTALERWENKLKLKCNSCGSKNIKCVNHSNEFLTVCYKCGVIIDKEIVK